MGKDRHMSSPVKPSVHTKVKKKTTTKKQSLMVFSGIFFTERDPNYMGKLLQNAKEKLKKKKSVHFKPVMFSITQLAPELW